MAKENDGTAKRKDKIRKLIMVAILCGVILVLAEIMGYGVVFKEQQRQQLDTEALLLQRLADHHRRKKRSDLFLRGQEKDESFKDKNNLSQGDADNAALRDQKLQRQEDIKKIISGEMTLVDIKVDSRFYQDDKKKKKHQDQYDTGGSAADDDVYTGVTGIFCEVNFQVHKDDPSKVPMFRFIIEESKNCKKKVKADLHKIVSKVREHDEEMAAEEKGEKKVVVKTMQPKGFVFHESRCGSTLVANSLIAMNPTQHRVYSESPPPVMALKSCGETLKKCPMDKVAKLFQDVIYLMGRTASPEEENLFFKMQSVGSREISVFRHAFPETPWIFVYRDPVQVMASQLKATDIKNSNCVRTKYSSPPPSIRKYLNDKGLDKDEMTDEDYCAVHLATITESAWEQLTKPDSHGLAVNYEGLVDSLMDHIIPNHFGVPVGAVERKRITDISAVYSKGKGRKAGMEWEEDTKAKEELATPKMRDAAESYLQSSYEGLQAIAVNN